MKKRITRKKITSKKRKEKKRKETFVSSVLYVFCPSSY